MIQQQVYILNTFLMIIDAAAVIVAGYVAFFIRYYISPAFFGYTWTMETDVFVSSVMLVMFFNNYLLGRLDLYSDRRPASFWIVVWHIFQGVAIDFGILSTGIFLLQLNDYSRLFLGLFASLSFVFLVSDRFLVHSYLNYKRKKGFALQKILILGDEKRTALVQEILNAQVSWGHEIFGRAPFGPKEKGKNALNEMAEFARVLQTNAIDEVIFAMSGDNLADLSEHLKLCRKIGVSVKILPSLWNASGQSINVESYQNVPFLTMQTGTINASGILYKRILDICGGLAGTLLLLLIYPLVGAAIKLDSPGPVIFKQKRVGRRGRIFDLYKFRSMYEDAERQKADLLPGNIMTGAIFKIENDPRVTRVGRFLRKTSLDELPQFLNVLKGEMSLVGTRPPTIDEVEGYRVQHFRRISAKPGITGMWQISGRNKITDFDEIVQLDLKYLDEWRFLNDIRVLLKTVVVLFQRKGAM